VNSFDPFLSRLGTIHDPRRAEGKLYQLPYILLFSILAIVTGANSYRGIRTFIKVQLKRLNKAFKIGWKRPPAHTAIRYSAGVKPGGCREGLSRARGRPQQQRSGHRHTHFGV
jgi:DDE_Tnp_1-associated